MSAIVIHTASIPTERAPLIATSPRNYTALYPQPTTLISHDTPNPPRKYLDRSIPLKENLSTPRFIIICIGIWSANFIFAFQSTAVPTLAPSISSGFQHAELSAYLGSIFSLASATGTSLSVLYMVEEIRLTDGSDTDIRSTHGYSRKDVCSEYSLFLLWGRSCTLCSINEYMAAHRCESFCGREWIYPRVPL